MKHKDEYTLEDLYNNLTITITELSKLANMSEGTIRRIRRRFPTRRSTANKLLEVFSGIYQRDLSLDNVTGIELEVTEKPIEPSILPSPIADTAPKKKAV